MSGEFALRFRDRTIASSRQLEIGLLAGIVVVAAALRLYKLGEWSFWIDEIFTINRAQAHVNIQTILAYWWQPSTSTIITGITLDLLGVSEFSARLPAAVVGTITLPIIYFLVRQMLGIGAAMITTILLALAPWHLYWSQNARYLITLLLFYSLSSFALYLAIEKDRPRYLLAFFVFLFLALGERLTAAFLVPVVVLYLAALKFVPLGQPAGLRWRNLFLLSLPFLGAILFDLGRLLTTGESSLYSTVETFAFQAAASSFRLLPLVTFQIGVPLAVFAVSGGLYLTIQKSRAGFYLLLNALVPFGIVLGISPFFFTVDRYVFMTLPFWVALAAYAAKQVLIGAKGSARILAAAVVLVFVADAAGSLLMYYQINNGNRPDSRRLMLQVKEQAREDDVIVSSVPALATYYMGLPVGSLRSVSLAELRAPDRRYWVIMESEVGAPAEMKHWLENNAKIVAIDYLRAREKSYSVVYLIGP